MTDWKREYDERAIEMDFTVDDENDAMMEASFPGLPMVLLSMMAGAVFSVEDSDAEPEALLLSLGISCGDPGCDTKHKLPTLMLSPNMARKLSHGITRALDRLPPTDTEEG